MATPVQVQQKVLKVPFQIGDRGEVAFVTQPSVVAAQEITSALLTMQGERVMRPGIGSGFGSAVFENFPSHEVEFIRSELQTTLSRHCRYSTIHFVRMRSDQLGSLLIEVGFTPIAVSSNVLVITVPVFTAFER